MASITTSPRLTSRTPAVSGTLTGFGRPARMASRPKGRMGTEDPRAVIVLGASDRRVVARNSNHSLH
jgi:hypothetical protein